MKKNNSVNKINNFNDFINNLKENDNIQFINYKWNKENNMFDIYVTIKQKLKYIDVNFTLTPTTGVTFK